MRWFTEVTVVEVHARTRTPVSRHPTRTDTRVHLPPIQVYHAHMGCIEHFRQALCLVQPRVPGKWVAGGLLVDPGLFLALVA